VPVEDTIHLSCPADIQALYHMTPYCWKTAKEGAERLAQLEKLDCRIAFRIHIFQKEEDSL
jgi:23S rRNA (guanine745-N1)-methyltransferase